MAEGSDGDARLAQLRRALYRRDAGPQAVAAYERALAEAAPQPGPAPQPRRSRRPALLAAAGAVVALAAVVVASLAVRQDATPVPTVTGRPLRLDADPAGLAALRTAIRGDTESAAAPVTTTALQQVPVLAAASFLSESDTTGTGSGVLAIPDLDRFRRQRAATVLVFCADAATYRWSLRADRRGPDWTGLGTGSCGRLSSATIALPPGLHATSLTLSTAPRTRFLLVLITTG